MNWRTVLSYIPPRMRLEGPQVEPEVEPDVEPAEPDEVPDAPPAEPNAPPSPDPNRSPFRRPEHIPGPLPVPKARRPRHAAINYHPDYEERLHPTLQEAIETGDTPFHGNRSIPGGRYLDETASDRFRNIIEEVRQHTGVSAETLYGTIVQIKKKIQALERPHRAQLEDLAVRLCMEHWGVEEGEVNIDAKIVDSGEIDYTGINTQMPGQPPEEDTQEQKPPVVMPETEVPVDPVQYRKEVEKRRMVNSFIQGSATKAKYLIHMGQEEINSINPELVQLYKIYIPLVSLSWWIKPVGNRVSGILGGKVELDSEDDEGPMGIIARGTTFPTLVSEIIKGLMELVSLHGLPQDSTMYDKVLEETDTLYNERWDLRYGPVFWDRLLEQMDVEDPRKRAMMYEQIVRLPADDFAMLVRGVLQQDPQAKVKLQEIKNSIEGGGEDDWRNAL